MPRGVPPQPDTETVEPVPDGEPGELVLTTLTKPALPMLRYRTRDITRLERAPCDCGLTRVRILRVTGRNDDMPIIRGVNVYPSQNEAGVCRPGLSPHYRPVLDRHGALDNVRPEVEADPVVAPADCACLGQRRRAPLQVDDRRDRPRCRCSRQVLCRGRRARRCGCGCGCGI